MKTTLVIVIGMIFAGVAGVAWNAGRVAHGADAALAAVAQKTDRTNAEIRRAGKRLAAAEGEAASLRAALAGLEQAKAAKTTVPPSQSGPPSKSEQALAKILAESRERAQAPTAQLRQIAHQRAFLTSLNQPLFRTLGLSPAQFEKFIEIRMKNFENGMDLAALREQGLVAPKDPVVAKLRAEAKAEADAGYRELLGESGYQRFQEYNRTTVARDIIGGFGGVAVMAGTPFTAPQLEQLVQVIANASSGYRIGQSVGWGNIDWDIVDAQMRPLMSDAQWTLFETTDSPYGGTQNYSRALVKQQKALQADAASKAAQPAKP